MSIWNKNKGLWQDDFSFEIYLKASSDLINFISRIKGVSKDDYLASDFLAIANSLDDMFQSYEKEYGPIEDPLFFFVFAQANALFLQLGSKKDELGGARIGYVVNGYKEALTKHLLYPTFNEAIIGAINYNFLKFANDYDKNWYLLNKNKFLPVS